MTRDPTAHADTLALLNGVIVSGPYIKSAIPLSTMQVKVGLLAVQLGLGNMTIKTPLDADVRAPPFVLIAKPLTHYTGVFA